MPRFLAIDADAHGLLVAAGTARLGTATVQTVAAATDEPQPLSPATAKAVGQRLKEVLKRSGIAPAPVLLCVGRDKVVLRDIRHPAVPPADEPGLIRFQAAKELTEGADEVVIDYEPLPGTEATGDKRASVAALRREMLAAARVMCEAAGLKLAAVTPRAFALAAAARRATADGAAPPPEPADAPVAVVSLTEAGGEFAVFRGKHVRFARAIPAAVAASEQALTAELRRNLTVYAGQAGDEVQAVYLAEAEAAGTGWAGRLRLALDVPVFPFDPLAGSAEAVPARLRGRFAGPVGLLAAKAAHLPINFVEPRQPKADTGTGRTKILLAALAAVVLLGSGVLGGMYMVGQSEERVARLKQEITDREEDIKRMDPDAKRVAAADEFEAHSIVWLDEFYDLTDRFPDIASMKVLDFKGDALPLPTLQDRKKSPPKPRKPTDPPKPVAKLKLSVATANGELPEKLLTNLDTRYYIAPRTSSSGAGGAGGVGRNQQQFTVDMQLANRKPTEYTRRLKAALPTPPPADPEPDAKPAANGASAP